MKTGVAIGHRKITVVRLICCQRDKEKCNMIGSDGQEYVFIGSAKGSGSSIYEERTQYELLRKKKTGINYSHISKPQKRELKPIGSDCAPKQ